jgi:chromosomal replication initiator protein
VADPDLNYGQIWQNTLTALDADGVPAQQRAFLSLARFVGLLDGTALVKVPNDFTKDVVETRVRDQVTRALSSQLGTDVRLAVTVDSSLDRDDSELTTGLDTRPLHLAEPVLPAPHLPARRSPSSTPCLTAARAPRTSSGPPRQRPPG